MQQKSLSWAGSYIYKREINMRNLGAWCCLVSFVMIMMMKESVNVEGAFDYSEAVDKNLMFFEAQRSGYLPHNQRVKWRANSGLHDGFLQGVDLVGGYYDGGDHVKFGLPMAYSVTMLSWGAIEFRSDILGLNQMGNTLDAIKWGTDYFIKAHPEPNILWGQVGNGESDHYCWERAEDMTTPRNGYKLDETNPGSDLAAETSAALAAASIAFAPYNSSYSNLLLLHAKQLFTFADTFRGSYVDSIKSSEEFYPSSGYKDELLWAAAWLFRATKEDCYLKYVSDNAASMGGTGWAVKEFSWDNKYAGVQVLLSKVLLEGSGGAYTSTLKQYQAKADFFACACLQKNDGYNVDLTPGGLMYVREWNNLQYAASASFLLAVYSEYLTQFHAVLNCPNAQLQPKQLLDFSQSQADYILGKNPKSMSYIVGYSKNYPIHVHHRGASIASISILHTKVGCVQGFQSWYRRIQANPNVIFGALVGGPDKNDDFIDDRSNYEQTEPTLSANAPLVGLLSKLQSVAGDLGYHRSVTPGPSPKSGYNPKITPAMSLQTDKPIKFLHSITSSWSVGRKTYYRHKVIIKNSSLKQLTKLKLKIENLEGSIYGLYATKEKHIYDLPQWQRTIEPGSECIFVYVQGGPQAKVSVHSYHS